VIESSFIFKIPALPWAAGYEATIDGALVDPVALYLNKLIQDAEAHANKENGSG